MGELFKHLSNLEAIVNRSLDEPESEMIEEQSRAKLKQH
jgi:hypothetical protein